MSLPEWVNTAEFVYYGITTNKALKRIPCVMGDDGAWRPTERVEYTPDWRTVFEINGVESLYQTFGPLTFGGLA